MDNVVLLSGNSNVDLATKIAEKLGMKLNEKNIPTMFANTESHPQIQDNLRGKDIFIVQSGCIHKSKNLSVNDIKLLLSSGKKIKLSKSSVLKVKKSLMTV